MSSKFRKTFSFDGKRYYVYGNSYEDVIEKMTLKKKDLEDGKLYRESSLTVSEWSFEAVEKYKTNQGEETREKYIGVLKSSVLSPIGNMKLKNISPMDLQDCLNMQGGKSTDHIDRVYRMLKFIFSTAKANKLITSDPTEKLAKPKGTTNHRRSITSEEREAFLEVTKDDRFVVFLLMYHCGCRPSEARKITSKDISVVSGKTLLHIKGTKTKKSDRYVPIPTDLAKRVTDTTLNKSQFVKLTNKLRNAMRDYMGGEFVYKRISPTGKKPRYEKDYYIDPLAKDFVPYCLRHTFCTDLRDKGVDIRDAQYLMGHSNISTTANIYTHSDISTALRVADTI